MQASFLYSLQLRNQRTRIGLYNLNIVDVLRPQLRNSAAPIQSMIDYQRRFQHLEHEECVAVIVSVEDL